jgi:oligosaccharide repeat unit polymerase
MEFSISNLNIVFYITLWLVTLIAYQLSRKQFDAGSVILFSYLVYSIASLWLYNIITPYYFYPIAILPFIYLFLMLIFSISPILFYNDKKIKEIYTPNNYLLNTVSIIFIVASLAHLPTIISDFSTNIIKLVIESSGGKELYEDAMLNTYDIGDGNISNFAAIISGAFSSIGVLLFFYYLTIKKPNKLILGGLFLSIIVSLLSSISQGQRGLIIEVMFAMVITYFALRKFMPNYIKKTIKITGIILIVIITLPIIFLTNSRFEKDEGGPMASVIYYAGQENLYFNNFGLNNNGIRYGDRTIPLYKRMVGFYNVPKNFWDRRQKYPNLKINDEVFYTFVGDFTFDFGPIIATLIIIGFSLFVLKKTKVRNGRILFHQLILLHFVMIVCMMGGLKLYPFSDVGGNLQLLVYVFAYIVFRLDFDLNLKKRNRNLILKEA